VKIIKPFQSVTENKSGERSGWFDEWLANQGKFVELNCGCIDDIHLPTCLTLITSKDIQIYCDNHGFQGIKRSLTFKQAMKIKGYDIPEIQSEDPLF
jgi:hypothetical protein